MKRFFLLTRVKRFILICVIAFCCGCSGSLISSSWWDTGDDAYVKDIIGHLNQARAKGRTCGNTYYKPAGPVTWNDRLGQASLAHSLDMARNGFLSHRGSDNSDPEERLAKAGYRWTSYGENVGQGYRSPDEALRAWLKSEMHCKNIMNPAFAEAGAAYAKSKTLRMYWTLVLGKAKP